MIRPVPLARPVCPMCGEPGIHATNERCIEALKAEIDILKARVRTEPSVTYLDAYYCSFWP